MASSTQFAQEYQQALNAYMSGKYEEAAATIDRLVQEYPQDANLRLLKGHIYCCQQHFSVAQAEYQQVLELSEDPDLLECARSSLADAERLSQEPYDAGAAHSQTILQDTNHLEQQDEQPMDVSYVTAAMPPRDLPGAKDTYLPEMFTADADTASGNSYYEPFENSAYYPNLDEQPAVNLDDEETLLMDRSGSLQESPDTTTQPQQMSAASDSDETGFWSTEVPTEAAIADAASAESHLDTQVQFSDAGEPEDETTLLMGGQFPQDTEAAARLPEDTFSNDFTDFNPDFLAFSDSEETEHNFTFDRVDQLNSQDIFDQDFTAPMADNLTFTDDSWQSEESTDLASDLSVYTSQPPNQVSSNFSGDFGSEGSSLAAIRPGTPSRRSGNLMASDRFEPYDNHSDSSPKQGLLAPFEQASLKTKQVMTAATAGVVSALAVVIIGQVAPGEKNIASTGLMALAAGIAGGATTLALGQMSVNQVKRSTLDLQTQINAVTRGDLNAKATPNTDDELGNLASSFNQMMRVISAVTSEAQRKAEEQEKAKEELQRQVIRLLDDVEGAARGDLTVQAEVTADILGAVADSFNLTINNLQKIVQQVKTAARQVNQGATENESFARSLSSDALRQAEELAVTLNSVQMLTGLIQRVADSAREADTVARSASATALKGGEAVELTVAGILQIRETVAETTRKVKRLAESSQEISKIVGFISQIASRTNLLALNASIEAARAGDAGRGFAVVADEVRQLADRASKSSKEIEQIVLQIQSETGSVMTAMEEGTQQVIEGTRRAEQAKHALEDIIQVSSKIDQLVRSITSATVEQTETSRAMAQVMQSVELTAQETSQEAQRVSASLQELVVVARDLQASVERFKVDSTEIQG